MYSNITVPIAVNDTGLTVLYEPEFAAVAE